jgi:hypothetical protein
MSSHEIQLYEDQCLDMLDELIHWALVDEVAGEEPPPQVWQNIQARVTANSRARPSRWRVKRPWRRFASILQACAWGFMAPLDAQWDSRLAPGERSYLIWRQNFLLSLVPVAAAKIC